MKHFRGHLENSYHLLKILLKFLGSNTEKKVIPSHKPVSNGPSIQSAFNTY